MNADVDSVIPAEAGIQVLFTTKVEDPPLAEREAHKEKAWELVNRK